MVPREAEWAYANNGRIAAAFLGLAMLFLVVGLLTVVGFGSDAVDAAVTLGGIGTFLLIFSVLVFFPRLARRGGVSFSAYLRRPMDEVEKAVREAIEASGRTPRVDVARSRAGHPPRIVTADGIPARFRIEVTRHPATAESGADWTEIIESFSPKGEAEAQLLREKITERLAGGPPPDR